SALTSVISMIAYSLINPSLRFRDPPPSALYTLSLHDALPIWLTQLPVRHRRWRPPKSSVAIQLTATCKSKSCFAASATPICTSRSEEHTSELQSRFDLVCRLLLEKKNKVRQWLAAVLPQTRPR